MTVKSKTKKNTETRRLLKDEKRLIYGSAPNPIKTAANVAKKMLKVNTALHKKSKGVRDATMATKPWAMGSMK
tara:strand:- start:106 stop:324 length:219 start_codon:yes stop_codon:yes gene_type:complete